MAGFGFAQPALLWGLAALPLLWLLRRWAARRRQTAVKRWAGRLEMNASTAAAGSMLLVALLVVAAAGPTWGQEPRRDEAEGRDLIVLLDVSRSMLAEDGGSFSRLARARRMLFDLLDRLEKEGRSERFALVAFAGQAKTLSPFTFDYDHVRYALRQAGPELFRPEERLAEGSALAAACRQARRLWDQEPSAVCDVLLVGDGDPAEDGLTEALAPLTDAKLRLHVCGVGDPMKGWPIPTGRPEAPFLLVEDPSAADRRRVLTRRQDLALQETAHRGGGAFVAEADQALARWWKESIRPLPGRRNEGTVRSAAIPRGGWLIGIALAGIAIGLLRPLLSWPPRLQRTAALGAASALALLGGASDVDGQLRAQAAYQRADWSAALALYAEAAKTTGDPGRLAFNQAACLMKMERWADAAQAYRRSLEDAVGQRAGLAWLGRGDALAQLGARRRGPAGVRLLEEALAAYAEADAELQPLAPTDIHVLKNWLPTLDHNRAQVEELLRQKRQEPPPPEEETNRNEPPPLGTEEGSGDGPAGGGWPKGQGQELQPPPSSFRSPLETDQQQPGAGSLPLVPDVGPDRPPTPEEAERLLRATLDRLQRLRRLQGAGEAILPPTKRDW